MKQQRSCYNIVITNNISILYIIMNFKRLLNTEEINSFLDEKEDEPEKSSPSSEEKTQDSSNPFKALFGGYNKKLEKKEESSDKKKEKTVVRKESFAEKEYIRPCVANEIKKTVFILFDIYKKAHGMASFT